MKTERWGAEMESSKSAKGQSSWSPVIILKQIRFTAYINSIAICCSSRAVELVYRIRTTPFI